MFCSHCGGSNPDGAVFCQYCGSSLTPSSSAPLPSMTPPPPPPPPPGWGPRGQGGPPPRRSSAGRTLLTIIVVFVVILLVFGVISYLLAPASSSGPAVTITGVNFTSPDNACGLNGAIDPSWYNTSAGQSFPLSYDISGNVTGNVSGVNTTAPCEIYTLTTTTPGFNITDANVPLYIAANTTQILGFTVNPPNAAFSGVLTLVLT